MCVVCLCVVCVCSFMNYLWYMVAYRLTKVGNPTVGFPVGKHTMTYVSFPLPPPFPPTPPYSPPYIVWQSVVILQPLLRHVRKACDGFAFCCPY